jgi:hypothetical protein
MRNRTRNGFELASAGDGRDWDKEIGFLGPKRPVIDWSCLVDSGDRLEAYHTLGHVVWSRWVRGHGVRDAVFWPRGVGTVGTRTSR